MLRSRSILPSAAATVSSALSRVLVNRSQLQISAKNGVGARFSVFNSNRSSRSQFNMKNVDANLGKRFEEMGGSTESTLRLDMLNYKFKVFIFNNSGEFTSCSFPRQETHKMIPGVPLRDLHRTVWNSQRQISTIVVREGCLVVKLEHLKGIIQDKSFILFDADNNAVKKFATEELADALRVNNFPPSVSKTSGPDCTTAFNNMGDSSESKFFEFIVLDSMLTSITVDFEHRLNLLIPVVNKALDFVASIANEEALTRLMVMKNSLVTFEYSVKEFRSALNDLLQSDEDLSNMYLSRKAAKKDSIPTVNVKEDHTEIEFMLENFYKRSEEILNEILKIKERISSTMSLIQTTQEVTLNNTLQLNLSLSMMSLGIASGSLVSGIFGMNLVNHLEQSPIAFACASSSIAGIVCGTYLTISTIYKQNKKMIRRQSKFASSNMFFDNINSIDFVSGMYNQVGNTQFMQAIEQGIGIKLSREETNKLFSEYDMNKNGILERQEFDSAMGSLKRKEKYGWFDRDREKDRDKEH